jgi:hypothetical protein
MGPAAKSGIPALIDALGDPNTCYFAANVLGSMGPEAESALHALKEALAETEDLLIRKALDEAIEKIER